MADFTKVLVKMLPWSIPVSDSYEKILYIWSDEDAQNRRNDEKKNKKKTAVSYHI